MLILPLITAMLATLQTQGEAIGQAIDTAGRDLSSTLDDIQRRLAALESAAQGPGPGPQGPGPQDAPWPAPAGMYWLVVPVDAQLQDGEAVDVHGRSLRIPDPQRPGFVRCLVPVAEPAEV